MIHNNLNQFFAYIHVASEDFSARQDGEDQEDYENLDIPRLRYKFNCFENAGNAVLSPIYASHQLTGSDKKWVKAIGYITLIFTTIICSLPGLALKNLGEAFNPQKDRFRAARRESIEVMSLYLPQAKEIHLYFQNVNVIENHFNEKYLSKIFEKLNGKYSEVHCEEATSYLINGTLTADSEYSSNPVVNIMKFVLAQVRDYENIQYTIEKEMKAESRKIVKELKKFLAGNTISLSKDERSNLVNALHEHRVQVLYLAAERYDLPLAAIKNHNEKFCDIVLRG